MEESISVFDANLTGGVALVVGTEHQGLSDLPELRERAQEVLAGLEKGKV